MPSLLLGGGENYHDRAIVPENKPRLKRHKFE